MMRFEEIAQPRRWRKYIGEWRDCTISNLVSRASEVAHVQCGRVETGRTRVFAGYFVQVMRLCGSTYLAEHPHSLRRALLAAEDKLKTDGWTLDVIGISP